jgi:hypothetical protein
MKSTYTIRLDFYWQAVASYALSLFVYGFLRGSFHDGIILLNANDPVLLLLMVLMLGSSLVLLWNFFMGYAITFDGGNIIIRNRFRTRILTPQEVISISIGREKRFKVRGKYKVIKLKIYGRKQIIRVRPSLYDQEEALLQDLRTFAQGINHV